MKNRCIYCNNENGLSESDIIPDTMTNVRILNKNVCEEFHNKPFSDFENEVFNDFSFILNKLDIRSHKKSFSDSYPRYRTDYMINGKYYQATVSSSNDLLTGKVALKGTNGEKIILDKGNAKRIVKESYTGETRVEEIHTPLEFDHSRTYITQDIFFSINICRLMSKIAFEWYCKENNITGRKDEFTSIIDYVTTGKGTSPVTIMQDLNLYEFMDQYLSDRPGSHHLLCLVDETGYVNVYISFFDLIIYHVIVAKTAPKECKNNFLYLVINTDGTKEKMCFSSVSEFAKKCNNIMIEQVLPAIFNTNNIETVVNYGEANIFSEKPIVGIANKQLQELFKKGEKYNSLLKFVELLSSMSSNAELEISSLAMLNEDLFDWITKRIEYTLQVGIVHLRKLKHFVVEHSLCNQGIINLETASPSDLFNYFYLLKIGEIKPVQKIDNDLIVAIYKQIPICTKDNMHIALTEEYGAEIKKHIMKIDNYQQLIYEGAEFVRK